MIETRHEASLERAPRILLRIEGVVILSLAVTAYTFLGQSWWLFAALFLVPDVFMLGYLAGNRIGAGVYNFGHTLTVPALVGLAAYWLDNRVLLAVAFIWLAHIGFDRIAGYGLKLASGFKHTHLS